jgi:hypothetical protein
MMRSSLVVIRQCLVVKSCLRIKCLPQRPSRWIWKKELRVYKEILGYYKEYGEKKTPEKWSGEEWVPSEGETKEEEYASAEERDATL